MNSERNNLLTASRQGCYLRCQRAHYWQCEVGLRSTGTTHALRFGTAWHSAMEARWNGATYEEAFEKALGTSTELEAYTYATLGALLAGYYWYYGTREEFGKLLPEQQFEYALEGAEPFSVAGKLDGLGSLLDERTAIIESKTTRDSIAPESDYWLRLRFNTQVYQYIHAARNAGWDVSVVIYDVTRKPGIKPKMVNDLDGDGLKIVLGKDGRRVYNKNGKPRLTASEEEGYTLKQHRETAEEFGERLLSDIQARPEFYFQRREVPILEDEIQTFEAERLTIARQIIANRKLEQDLDKKENAWPRAVSTSNCRYCSYQSFCLQNLSIDVNSPPSGFKIEAFNPELIDNSVNEDAQDQEQTTE